LQKKINMHSQFKKCFVCEQNFIESELSFNQIVNLFVCHNCSNTENEKQKETEMLDSLADGLVCGCI
jgi:hypothetical protein